MQTTERGNRNMIYSETLTSALEYARAGKTEEWVHAYLLSDGGNKPFSDGLKMRDRYYFGIYKMPAAFFHRCCGYEDDMRFRVPRDGFLSRVEAISKAIASGADMPPIIVNYSSSGFELNDGNHRHEAYAKLGVSDIFVVVWITEKSEYDEFAARYSRYAVNS